MLISSSFRPFMGIILFVSLAAQLSIAAERSKNPFRRFLEDLVTGKCLAIGDPCEKGEGFKPCCSGFACYQIKRDARAECNRNPIAYLSEYPW